MVRSLRWVARAVEGHAATPGAAAPGLAAAVPAQAAEYSSALKIKGMQYDAPGRGPNKYSGGNTKNKYLTIKNYSKTAAVNLKDYTVKDAAGNTCTFKNSHALQHGDYASQESQRPRRQHHLPRLTNQPERMTGRRIDTQQPAPPPRPGPLQLEANAPGQHAMTAARAPYAREQAILGGWPGERGCSPATAAVAGAHLPVSGWRRRWR
ncbi:lamin tail domain-containing protein [Streptomyces anthocyanicus]|uniref:lamin tail domain-containing protein n=1 Tax=Streptomyces anthocyanicus TaxID=68174 RepID=UPI00365EAFBD